MTISELIEELKRIEEDHGDIPVRGVFQPDYPLLAEIDTVTTVIEESGTEVFIGLDSGRDYGTREHYAGGEVVMGEDDDEDGE